MIKSSNLLVLRGDQLDELCEYYAKLGFQFAKERHGNGPVHYSANFNGAVLELYPGTSSGHVVGGFGVDSIKDFIELCNKIDVKFKEMESSVIIRDPSGNKLLISQI